MSHSQRGTGKAPQVPFVPRQPYAHVLPPIHGDTTTPQVPVVSLQPPRYTALQQQRPVPIPQRSPVPIPQQRHLPEVPLSVSNTVEPYITSFPSERPVPVYRPVNPNIKVEPPPKSVFKPADVNPYIRLSRPILDAIASERDIMLSGGNRDRAAQLFEYDQIMPDWLESVTENTIHTFQVLSGPKLYVFGSIHGVEYNDVPGMTDRDLINYIRVSFLLNNPGHPGRSALRVLVPALSRSLLEVFGAKLGLQHGTLRFIESPELSEAILRGDTNGLSLESITAAGNRYTLLTTHKYRDLLAELYNIDDEDGWVLAARSDPSPMESVILHLDSYPHSEIIKVFGMVIPISHSNSIGRYIVNNIVSYSKIVDRGNLDKFPPEVCVYMEPRDLTGYFSKLTDNEIFNILGVSVPYNSRAELVRDCSKTLTRPGFMFPVVRSPSRSINSETLMFTPIDDLDTFMVCYGTALKYYTYELADLIGSFHSDDETQVMEFRRPENPNLRFSDTDINGLLRLLKCFPETHEITLLTERIAETILSAKEKIAHDNIARTELSTFNKDTKELIRGFLHGIFTAGMYMRRWDGPGHPYPLRADDTKNKPEPDKNVGREVGACMELLKEMGSSASSFCMRLKTCQYTQTGSIDLGGRNFLDEWNGVIKGKRCIRMSSTTFIGTGLHYLRALYRENIPGVDVERLDRIM